MKRILFWVAGCGLVALGYCDGAGGGAGSVVAGVIAAAICAVIVGLTGYIAFGNKVGLARRRNQVLTISTVALGAYFLGYATSEFIFPAALSALCVLYYSGRDYSDDCAVQGRVGRGAIVAVVIGVCALLLYLFIDNVADTAFTYFGEISYKIKYCLFGLLIGLYLLFLVLLKIYFGRKLRFPIYRPCIVAIAAGWFFLAPLATGLLLVLFPGYLHLLYLWFYPQIALR